MMYEVVRECNDEWGYEVYNSYDNKEEAIAVANKLNKDIDINKCYGYEVVEKKY